MVNEYLEWLIKREDPPGWRVAFVGDDIGKYHKSL